MISLIDKNENDVNNDSKLGNKGRNLLLMKKNGFNVPGGFVLNSDAYDLFISENNIKEDIKSLLTCLSSDNVAEISEKITALFEGAFLPERVKSAIEQNADKDTLYAVRSSGSKEDLEDYSFAGQYDTFLNVIKADIADRVIDCYRSMFSPVVLRYLIDNSLDPKSMKMSVVVQEMVPADFSGICFTANPVSGRDKEMLIEVSEGLGEDIVSGRTAPEQYFYDWYERRQLRRPGCGEGKLFRSEALIRCCEVFADIQQLFGWPCDIEFAVKDDTLYILQARRITGLQYGSIPDIWTTADFKEGGVSASVCTPYMWSLYEYIWEYSFRKFVVNAGLIKEDELPDKIGEMFFGRCYWNLSVAKKAMSRVIGYREREFDSEYGINGDYEGDGQTTGVNPRSLARLSVIALKQAGILHQRKANAQRYKDELLLRYDAYKSAYDAHNLKNIEKYFYRLTKKTYLCSESIYFIQIFINTVQQALYKDRLLKYVSESDYLSLLGSIDNISHLLPFYEMWDVTRHIRKDENALKYWQERPAGEIAGDLDTADNYCGLVREIIDRYGYHSDKELDITYPCYYEDPEAVVRTIKELVLLDDDYSPETDRIKGNEKRERVLSGIRAEVSAHAYKRIERNVTEIRKMLWWREEFKDISTRFYYLLRVYTIEYTKKLVGDLVLDSIEDVWFLKVGDLWDYIEGKKSREDLRGKIEKNRRYYNAFRNYMSDDEIGGSVSQNRSGVSAADIRASKAGDVLKGVSVNNGTVTGTARVIEDFSQIERLKEDDILVTRFTDTGWTPKFAILSGIVTEYGGILCHAAIVSREYDIPSVVCCKGAVQKIRDGQTITIDGASGVVICH